MKLPIAAGAVNHSKSRLPIVIAPMKKPDDFQLNLSADGQTVEIMQENGETQRISIHNGKDGKPAVEMTGAGMSIIFSAKSNASGKMDVRGGALPQ